MERLGHTGALFLNNLVGTAEELRFLQGGNPCQLGGGRDVPGLAAHSHPLQHRRIAAQAVAQPKPSHAIAFGKGFQKQQVGHFPQNALEAQAVAILGQIQEALVHKEEDVLLVATGGNLSQQRRGDDLTGGVVGIAQHQQLPVKGV